MEWNCVNINRIEIICAWFWFLSTYSIFFAENFIISEEATHRPRPLLHLPNPLLIVVFSVSQAKATRTLAPITSLDTRCLKWPPALQFYLLFRCKKHFLWELNLFMLPNKWSTHTQIELYTDYTSILSLSIQMFAKQLFTFFATYDFFKLE